MSSTLVIFSGLSFSYTALDHAIAWAQEHKSDLRVLFLQEEPVEEGYVFPSDIDAAEALTNEADAQQDDDQLIQGKIRLIKDKADAAGINYTTQIITAPSVNTILALATDVDKMFVDVGTDDRKEAADRLFKPEELSEKAACPVELVKAE
ncbi:universal stress protein [Pseudoflavitalea sp. X16]|uniref:universal stress protein n=1 Tax=Paraflavitalea devenefica TaxID=2716334 RepID=UPI0014240805|nr:universal stress protein [Paraflavitalea devenefica]NII28810.1 universal stress protein [Paraflavitalea devenefica]